MHPAFFRRVCAKLFGRCPGSRVSPTIEPLELRRLLAIGPAGLDMVLAPLQDAALGGPAVASAADGTFVVVWSDRYAPDTDSDVYGCRYAADGTPLSPIFRANDTIAGVQNEPVVAMEPDGSFTIAWTSQDGSGKGIFGRRYAAAGTPLAGEFLVNAQILDDQQHPAVAMDDAGDLIVVWQSAGQDGSGQGIYAQRYDAEGQPQGLELRVNTTTVGDQTLPAVAMNAAGEHVVAWQSGTSTIYAQQYDVQGQAIGGQLSVISGSPGPSNPAVAVAPNGDWMVSYQRSDGSGQGIDARRYTGAGLPRETAFRVNGYTSNEQINPVAAYDPAGGLVVAWESTGQDGYASGITARTYAASGVSDALEFVANNTFSGSQTRPAIAGADDQFVLAWQSSNPSTGQISIIARRFVTTETGSLGNRIWEDRDADGLQDPDEPGRDGVTVKLLDSKGRTAATAVTANGGLYRFDGVVPGSYRLQVTAPSGMVFTLANQSADDSMDSDVDPATGQTALLSLAEGEVNFTLDAGLVAPATVSGLLFDDRNGDGIRDAADDGMAGWTVYADSNGNGQRDGAEKYAITAADGSYTLSGISPGQYIVQVVPQQTWSQVLPASARTMELRGAQAAKLDLPVQSDALRPYSRPAQDPWCIHGETSGDQNDSAVAMDAAGNGVIAWTDVDPATSKRGVYGQRLDPAGAPVGAPFLVSCISGYAEAAPVVAMNANGAFAVVWSSTRVTADGDDIYARVYGADGVPAGPEFRVNQVFAGQQAAPAAALDGSGRLVVAWTTMVGTDSQIASRRFDTAGAALADEVIVNTYATNVQTNPAVAVGGDGQYVVAWSSYGQDGSQEGIYAQRFNGDGARSGNEFRVNTTISGAQKWPAAAMRGDGAFVIAWQSSGGIYAQRYLPDGQTEGGEVKVSTSTATTYSMPAAAMTASGQYIIVWIDTTGTSVFVRAQRFGAAGVRTDVEALISPATAVAAHAPGVALDAQGNALFTWTSNSGSTGMDVYARRYRIVEDAAVVAGAVWEDANANGLRDAGEAGAAGVTVRLYDGQGTLIGQATTSSAGAYRFTAVPTPGSYFIEFVQPGGRFFTLPNAGVNSAFDSDADRATGRTAVFSLSPDQVDVGHSAGLVLPGAISVWKFHDLDRDGIKAADELGLSGWSLYLDLNLNGQQDAGEPSLTESPGGVYSASGLDPLVPCRVEEVAQPDWTPTTPSESHWITPMAGGTAAGGLGSYAAIGGWTSVGPEIPVATLLPVLSLRPVVASDAQGNFVVVWESDDGIYGQRYQADGTPAGVQFAVDPADDVNYKRSPAVAMDASGRFAVVWYKSPINSTGGGIYLQWYDASGVASGGPIRVAANATGVSYSSPALAMNADGSFVLAYTRSASSETYVVARRSVAGGLSSQFEVSQTLLPQQTYARHRAPAVAINDTAAFVVTWENDDNDTYLGNDAIYARLYDGQGVALGGDFRVGDPGKIEIGPSVGMAADGSVAIVWLRDTALMAQRFGAAGQPLGSASRVNSTTASSIAMPALAMRPAGDFVITWNNATGDSGVRMQAYSRFGVPLGAEMPLGSTLSTSASLGVAVAISATGRAIAVWRGDNIMAARLQTHETSGVATGRVWTDTDGDGIQEAGEPGADNVTVYAVDEHGRRVRVTTTSNGGHYQMFLPPGQSFRLQVISPYSASGTLVLTTSKAGADRSIDSDVNPRSGLSDPFQISAGEVRRGLDAGLVFGRTVAGYVFDDADSDGVRDAGEAPLLDWLVYVDDNGNGQLDEGEPNTWSYSNYGYYQLPELNPGTHRIATVAPSFYNATSESTTVTLGQSVYNLDLGFHAGPPNAAIGPVGPANLPLPDHRSAVVSANPSGAYVVVWPSLGQLYAQRYLPDGTPDGSAITVHSHAAAVHMLPAVALRGDGTFVVAWESKQSGTDPHELYVRAFNAAGAPEGSESLLAARTEKHANLIADIDLDGAGNYIVTWTGQILIASTPADARMAQRFTASHQALGGPTVLRLGDCRLAMAADGSYALTWAQRVNGNSVIHAQRFAANGSPAGPEFRVGANDLAYQQSPNVVMNRSGAMVITWVATNSAYLEEYLIGSYAQRYDAEGRPLGPNFRVSDPKVHSVPGEPTAAIDDVGNVVIVGTSGSWYFTANGQATPCEPTTLYALSVAMDSFGNIITPVQRYRPVPGPASVGGIVWEDVNADGIRQPTEPGRSGYQVTLASAYGDWKTATTDASGLYRFDGLRAGEAYTLKMPAGSSYLLVAPNQGADDLDSDFDPLTRQVTPIVLAPGQVDLRQDAGLLIAGTVSGMVFNDLDCDGIRGPAEPGLAGWRVFVDSDDDGNLDATEPFADVSSDGSFKIWYVSPGLVHLRGLQPHWSSTQPVPMLVNVNSGEAVTSISIGMQSEVEPLYLTPLTDYTNVNQYTQSSQEAPVIGVDGQGNSIVVWTSYGQDGSQWGIYARRFGPLGQPLSNEFLITQKTSGSQETPTIAVHSSGSFVVAWRSFPDIYARRFDSEGNPLSDEVLIASSASYPVVAMDAVGNYIIAWKGSTVQLRRFNVQGEPLGAVESFAGKYGAPGLAMNASGQYVIVWDNGAQRFEADGTPLQSIATGSGSGIRRVGISDSGEGGFVQILESALLLCRFDHDGELMAGVRVLASGLPGNQGPAIAVRNDGSFAIVWRNASSAAMMQLYDAAGMPAGPAREVGYGTGKSSAMAFDSQGRLVIATDVPDANYSGIVTRTYLTYTADAKLTGRAWDDADHDNLQDPDEPGIGGIAVWLYDHGDELVRTTTTDASGNYRFDGLLAGRQYHVYLPLRDDLAGVIADHGGDDSIDSDIEPFARRSAVFTAPEAGATVDLDIGLVPAGRISGVKFADIDKDGRREYGEAGLEGWTIFLDTNGNGQLDAEERSTVTDANGAYAFAGLVASEYRVVEVRQDGWLGIAPTLVSVGIGQSLVADLPGKLATVPVLLAADGSQALVNVTTASDQKAPAVASASSGRSLVVWQGASGGATDIFGRWYTAAGQPDGGEFIINATTTGYQTEPAIAMHPDGQFVVVWTSGHLDSAGDIFAQRFDAAGQRVGGEIAVNTTTAGSQVNPVVAIDAAGSFLIAWTAANDGNKEGIHARRFNPDGTPATGEILVNTTTTGTQKQPSVAMNASGQAVIVWQGPYTALQKTWAIFARQVNADGSLPGSELLLSELQIYSDEYPDVAVQADGRFVVAWDGIYSDSITRDTVFRRYDAAGQPLGAITRALSASPTARGYVPAIAMDGSGGFVISCTSSNNIVARRWDVSGIASTGIIQVTTGGSQASSSVAVAADGRTMVVWQGPDSSATGVYARHYRPNGSPTTSGLPDLTLDEDAPAATINLATAFSDAEDGAALTYAVDFTSDTSLVVTSIAGGVLTISGGANRFGTATVVISATDTSGGVVKTPFTLTVRPVNDAPQFGFIPDQTLQHNAGQRAISLAGISPGPYESGPVTFAVSAENPGLFSEMSIVYTPGAATASLLITPAGALGQTNVTITVGDGEFTASRTFLVTVTPDVTAPLPQFQFGPALPGMGAIDQITLVFDEPVPQLELSQLALRRNNGQNLLGSAQTLTTADRITWVLGNLASITFVQGQYRLHADNVADEAGNARSTSSSTFSVSQTVIVSSADLEQWDLSMEGSDVVISVGARIYRGDVRAMTSLSLSTGAGPDTVAIHGPIPLPITLSGDGGDALSVYGGSGNDDIIFGGGVVTLGGWPIQYTGVEAVNVDGGAGDDSITLRGSASFANPPLPGPADGATPIPSLIGGTGRDTLILADGKYAASTDLGLLAEDLVVVNAVLIASGVHHLQTLTIGGAGSVQLRNAQTRAVLRASDVRISGDGLLDIGDGAIIVDAGPDEADLQERFSRIRTHIGTSRNQAYNRQLWWGKGITSDRAAAAATGNVSVTLNRLPGGTEPLLSEFADQPVGTDSIIIACSPVGDLDLNGWIDGDDYFRMDRSFLNGLGELQDGDLDYDGFVGGSDYFLIDRAYLLAPNAPSAEAAGALPEAATAPIAVDAEQPASAVLTGIEPAHASWRSLGSANVHTGLLSTGAAAAGSTRSGPTQRSADTEAVTCRLRPDRSGLSRAIPPAVPGTLTPVAPAEPLFSSTLAAWAHELEHSPQRLRLISVSDRVTDA